MNERILRGSDLADWYLTDSACRPLKGVEPARGIAPNRCNANLRRTDVPQQGPMLGLVGRRWAAADEGQAPSGESIQLQQRANKQEIGDSQGAEPLGGFLVPFCPYKKVPRGVGARSPHLVRVIRQNRTTAPPALFILFSYYADRDKESSQDCQQPEKDGDKIYRHHRRGQSCYRPPQRGENQRPGGGGDAAPGADGA